MSRIMGIDYGSKRLGVAISDSSATLAQPVTVVERSKIANDLMALAKLAKDYDVEEIVVGYPLSLTGVAGKQAAIVDSFIKKLEVEFALPVAKYDERLSSKEADVWLKQMGVRGKKARKKIDSVAAALILQSYMDRKIRGVNL
ncbi:MAG: Holliday junction resolvase RuvX [Actinomycetia bacterium]|nr:Holliday junction resolvase RuvX [Actinomycetes bacterium]